MELLERQLADQERKKYATEARLDRTKPLEELEEQREIIKRKIEEDRRIMTDEKSSTELKKKSQQFIFQKIQTSWQDWSPRFKKGKLFLCVKGLKISSQNMAGQCKQLFWPLA